MKVRILAIDDEKTIRDGLQELLELEDYSVTTAENGAEGLKALAADDIDIIICDLKMPVMGGAEFLRKAHAKYPHIPIIVLTGHGTIENAVDAMKEGAYDYLEKPINGKVLLSAVRRAGEKYRLEIENKDLRRQLNEKFGFSNIIGSTPNMLQIFDMIKIIAPTRSNILITGENGTGKEVIANAIHRISDREKMPFVKVHCAALNENLLESELFGHEKGAFTGAMQRKRGRFELADGGTLFLDEIGEISQATQVKLLRVLQEREFERVGGEETIKVDVRLLSATNKQLEQAIEQGDFREDLYYRLKVIHIEMPPLRERKSDIPLLAQSFVKEFCELNHKSIMQLSTKALAFMERYDWPGNVRELRNAIERAVVLTQKDVITEEVLPPTIVGGSRLNVMPVHIDQPMEEIEKQVILAALAYVDGNKSKAAEMLQIGRKTLHRKLESYKVQED